MNVIDYALSRDRQHQGDAQQLRRELARAQQQIDHLRQQLREAQGHTPNP